MEKGNILSLDKVISAKRESKHMEFKEKFDPNIARDWCEIIKDIVAMANSGGGTIVIGVRDDGSSSGGDVSAILRIDPAQVTDKIAKYTNEQFDKFAMHEADREGCKVAILQVECLPIPMVFTHPGTYDAGGGKHETAFSRGTIYFRHGAKSEPGNSTDLRASIEREITRVKKSWLGNIKKVVNAPVGHKVKFLPPELVEPDLPDALSIRIVDDSNAPAYRQVWDESAYRSPQEIVVGALKSWRRDKSSYASESDLWTLYAFRNNLQLDEEKAECLLESAINRHAPFFFFAQLLSHHRLIDFIKRVAVSDRYPAPNMLAKLAHAMGGKLGSELLDYLANNSDYQSVQSAVNRLKETILQRNRIKKVYGTNIKLGTQSIEVKKAKTSDLETLMADAINTENKIAIKQLDVLLYAPRLEVKIKK